MKKFIAAILFMGILGSLLILLSLAMYFKISTPHYNYYGDHDRVYLSDAFAWLLRLSVFELFTVFSVIFLMTFFIVIDSVFIIWFIIYIQVLEKPIMLKDSYRSLNKLDDIENMTILESIRSLNDKENNPPNSISSNNSISNKLWAQTSKFKYTNELPKPGISSETFANFHIDENNEEAYEDVDLSSAASSTRDLFFDGRPIEFRVYYGPEVLV